jgi:hypothetical protein
MSRVRTPRLNEPRCEHGGRRDDADVEQDRPERRHRKTAKRMQHPHGPGGHADEQQVREGPSGQRDRQFAFRRIFYESRGKERDDLIGEDHAGGYDGQQDQECARTDGACSTRRFCRTILGEDRRKDRHESATGRALRNYPAEEIGDPKRDEKRISARRRTEDGSDDDVTSQTRQPAEKRQPTEHAGRRGDASGFSGPGRPGRRLTAPGVLASFHGLPVSEDQTWRTTHRH